MALAAESVRAGESLAILRANCWPLRAADAWPGFDVPTRFGLVAPAGMPKDGVAQAQRIVTDGSKPPAVPECLATIGAEPLGHSPEELARCLREEAARWDQLIKERGIKPE